MNVALIVLLISLIGQVFTDDDEKDCKMHKSKSPHRRIQSMILCDYDAFERPVINHQNATDVYMRMLLKRVAYEEKEEILAVDSWLVVNWKDQHLTWNPSDYENVKSIYLSSLDIWTPDLSVYNRHDLSEHPSVISEVRCVVTAAGTVMCVLSNRQAALCTSDSTYFPFDVQNCSLRFGSWVHNGEEVNFHTSQPPVSMEDYRSSGEWTLLTASSLKNEGIYACCPNNTYPSLVFSFLIKRNSGLLIASVFIPAFVMILITLTVLWMNPTGMDRMCLACCNFLSHMLYVQYVRWELPGNGKYVPHIIVFARDSLLLSTFAVILTVALRNMLASKKGSPFWMANIVSSIVQSKPGQFVLLNNYSVEEVASLSKDEDGTNIIGNAEESEPQTNKDWRLLAVVLDRLAFLGFVITYISLFAAFVP